ncbi:MAG: polyprenyl synthetase family protein [Gammaproteobacteria bacterium]|nr:polyprenyl synthetase family protein [Gammaproteobacteria bacterium]
MTEITEYLATCSQRVELFFDNNLPSKDQAPTTLHGAIRYSAMNGGKRIRPALVYATGEALGINPIEIDCIAGAIELMHSYSLIHDDLPAMDDDDLRRGKPTCHRAYDEATAILAGDAMQALAFSFLTNLSIDGPEAAIRSQLTNQLAHAVGSLGMAGGQAMDLAAVDKNISIEALEYIHRQKTGCLIRACIDMTQTCCTTLSQQQRSSLLQFGEHLGIAFQIRDDILDVISDTDTLGKPQGSDSDQNKPTYVSILGIEESERRCDNFYQQALDCLENLDSPTKWLHMLAEHIVCRKH